MRRGVLIDETAGRIELTLVVEDDTVSAREGLPVPRCVLDVAESRQHPEIAIGIVVERCLAPKTSAGKNLGSRVCGMIVAASFLLVRPALRAAEEIASW